MAYLPLSTANLPDPVIDPAQGASPEDYFGTLLWTGTGGSRTIADGESGVVGDVNFTPDFCWIKSRSLAASHTLYDAVRTAGEMLQSDSTGAEQTDSAFGYLSSFTAGGFGVTTGTDGSNPDFYTNQSSETYVAWNWKANGSGVSNTDGSITSTVSANTESGFSVVSYTGTGSNATVGHGLSSAPEMIIFKERNGATNWPVYHSGLSSAAYAVELNQTIAQFSYPAYFQSTDPTSSVFYIGTDTYINNNTDNYIAYCFHSVEGFSKFGSYTGNGNADGTFVYTGFRPSFVIFKASSISGENWVIQDAARDVDNVVHHRLDAERSNAEATVIDSSAWPNIDFVSNGFKHRGAGNVSNGSGVTYIYMAFAEMPTKFSLAR